ncbi:hypothetical protein K0M31_015858 [Melipona bicolor]|uniref:Uncharacterized protein n=1 Tax=Melipona bicolor TaxID=60889 RepID=A0AA40KT13_9HYME|nr:hypothetical protein K0M31_015858 [Melipona bicolor]
MEIIALHLVTARFIFKANETNFYRFVNLTLEANSLRCPGIDEKTCFRSSRQKRNGGTIYFARQTRHSGLIYLDRQSCRETQHKSTHGKLTTEVIIVSP